MAEFPVWKKGDYRRRFNTSEMYHVDYPALLKMTLPERAELAQAMWEAFQRRRASFEKAGEFSYAVAKMEMEFEKVKDVRGWDLNDPPVIEDAFGRYLGFNFQTSNYPNQSLLAYISTMQSFFQAKSSTVEGARRINYEQDLRLFGKEYNVKNPNSKRFGKRYLPKNAPRLTHEQRRNFWRLFRELNKSDASRINDYSSESQREVAKWFVEEGIDITDFDELVAKALKQFGGVVETYGVKAGTPSTPDDDSDRFNRSSGWHSYDTLTG